MNIVMFVIAATIAAILTQCDGRSHSEVPPTVLWTARDVRADGTAWCVAHLTTGEVCDIDCRLVTLIDGGPYECEH